MSAVGPGWQAIVYEMIWEPSTGTSSNMFMLTSFYNRTASDSYGSEGGTSPLLMREEGLDYNEIAEALELSPGSVGTTLSRARRRLVESYEALQLERDEREKNAAS